MGAAESEPENGRQTYEICKSKNDSFWRERVKANKNINEVEENSDDDERGMPFCTFAGRCFIP